MKIKMEVSAYGGSKKLQVDLMSETDPQLKVSINSYYWKDVQDGEKLIKEMEAIDAEQSGQGDSTEQTGSSD